LKYTYDGEVRINVSLDETRAHDLQLLFEVKDGGEGIKPEDFKSIFDQYKQTEKLAEKSKAGKGLGLTICKNLVELMGGEIGVMSEEGSGSVFWFSISSPIVEEADLKAYRKKIAPENRNFDRLSKHVLVVEDKKVNQVVLGLMIQKLGCTFDVVDNGEEAIETFEEGKYDYIFMDIRMPKMNGFECTQMLKEKYTNVPPIIGLSGETYDGVVEESIAKGLDAYLFKPVQIEILYDKMIELNDYQA
jgi:CheY-like chemotaxis protein